MSELDEILASIPKREHYKDDGEELYVDFPYAMTLEQMLKLVVEQRDFMLTQMHEPYATLLRMQYDTALSLVAKGEG